MADKKRDILEFFEQSNFEQFTPTRFKHCNILTGKKSTTRICTTQIATTWQFSNELQLPIAIVEVSIYYWVNYGFEARS